MFSSFRVREFRLYWISMFISLLGSWIQSMAQSWLVFRMTRSAFLMGLVNFLSTLPVAFMSLAAGVYVDRWVKRNLLLTTQAVFTIMALVLAILVGTGTVQIWHVIVIAAVNGFVMSFDAPGRQSMVVELVGKQHLANAIALNSASFNSARIIGPAVAGVLIAFIGTAGCFFVNALSYIPVLFVLTRLKPCPPHPRNGATTVVQDIRESLGMIKGNKILLFLLGVTGLVSAFGVSYLVLMPIFAQDILHSGARGLAYLMSASGVGALIGALNIARLKNEQARFRVLHFSVIIFFLSAIIFSVSRSLWLSCALLVLTGIGAAGSMSIVNTELQTSVPDNHRGRTMGLYMMIFVGIIPFGSIIFGSLAQLFGAPAVVFFGAILSVLIYLPVSRIFFLKARLSPRISHEK